MTFETKNKYQILPEDVRKAVESVGMAEKIQLIGQKNNLHTDQIGYLAEVIDSVIVGDIDAEDLVEKIEERLGVDTMIAIGITTDVNIEIFSAIRELVLKKEEGAAVTTNNKKESNPSKESILAEIENPTPSVHPISAADQTVAGPAVAREILPETKSTVARDFIGSKLTETVSLPAQKATVTLKAPEKPKSYATDPYREALN